MKRSDFLENITTLDELVDICIRVGMPYICEDEGLLNADDYDARVKEDISDSWDNMQWGELGELISELPDWAPNMYYMGTAILEYHVADDYDFNRLKQVVLNHFDADDLWDEEEPVEEVSLEEIEAMLLSVTALVKEVSA